MKHTYRFFRNTTAAGLICFIGAAGTDERFAEMGQVPPESIEKVVVIGLLLLVPMALHLLRKPLRKGLRYVLQNR